MSEVFAVTSALPFCQKEQGEETQLSFGLRLTALALGIIALLVSVLIFRGFPTLSHVGWITFSIGALLALLSISIKCIEKPADEGTEKPENDPKPSDNIDSARKKFINWVKAQGSIHVRKYETEIEEIKQMSKDLPIETMTLHHYWFTHAKGFSFFYGQKMGEEKFIPVSWEDSIVIRKQLDAHEAPSWPIFDPNKNTYFVPKVVTEMRYPSETESMSEYLKDLLSRAKENRSSHDYLILEALTPYAKKLKNQCGDAMYKEIRALISAYPKDP
jgi:hypothetical protein